MIGAHEVVAFFLDECGMDVSTTSPSDRKTVLHYFVCSRPAGRIKAARMLKYLLEEKGADLTLTNLHGQDAQELAIKAKNSTYLACICGFMYGTPINVAELASSDEWNPSEDEESEATTKILAAQKGQEAQARKEKEAAAKALFNKEEARAKEATAALLAEPEAEEQKAAAATAKKKSKKANKKKGAGGQQAASAAVAASTAGRGVVVQECKAEDQELAPGQSLQQQQQQEQVQEQQQQQRRRRRGAPQEAAQEAATAAAMGQLSLNEVETASTPTIATASASAASTKGEDGDRKLPLAASASAPSPKEDEEGDDIEKDLEEEKHDFFFDGAADERKCSIGFCLMTEAVLAMDGFSYQKSSLGEYIAHCAAKGQPLTSPLTGEPMGAMYMPNHHVRTFVKDYIGEREKEWRLHVAQRRAGGKANEKDGKNRDADIAV